MHGTDEDRRSGGRHVEDGSTRRINKIKESMDARETQEHEHQQKERNATKKPRKNALYNVIYKKRAHMPNSPQIAALELARCRGSQVRGATTSAIL
jgi:hypothetical protein